MKVKQDEIHRYWRAKKEGVYERDKPGLRVRKATDKYLSKKQKMLDVAPAQDNWEESMLNDLISEIRTILGKKEEKV